MATQGSFSVKEMTRLLDNDNHETRQRFREILTNPIFIPRYDLSLEEERYINGNLLTCKENWRLKDSNFFAMRN